MGQSLIWYIASRCSEPIFSRYFELRFTDGDLGLFVTDFSFERLEERRLLGLAVGNVLAGSAPSRHARRELVMGSNGAGGGLQPAF